MRPRDIFFPLLLAGACKVAPQPQHQEPTPPPTPKIREALTQLGAITEGAQQ